MKKADYIKHIVDYTNGKTGINYQKVVGNILKIFFEDYRKQKYEMPRHYGGDEKNDGWVKNEAIFYQIFSPIGIKNSLKKDIQKKFSEDLEGLLKKICRENKWGGEIKEFIFLVNTHDEGLPEDSERFFDKKVKELEKEYGVKFDYKVEANKDYLYNLLYDNIENEDIRILEKISNKLEIFNSINVNTVNEKMIYDLIQNINENIIESFSNENIKTDYNRISSKEKIKINNLSKKKEHIENIITKLDVVEQAIKLINQDINSENDFERIKDYIVNKYLNLSKKYKGIELYEKIINELPVENAKTIKEYIIVYIFDKCDIFEKG